MVGRNFLPQLEKPASTTKSDKPEVRNSETDSERRIDFQREQQAGGNDNSAHHGTRGNKTDAGRMPISTASADTAGLDPS